MWSRNSAFIFVFCAIQLICLTESRDYRDVFKIKTSMDNIKGTSSKLQLLLDHYFIVSTFEINIFPNLLKRVVYKKNCEIELIIVTFENPSVDATLERHLSGCPLEIN